MEKDFDPEEYLDTNNDLGFFKGLLIALPVSLFFWVGLAWWVWSR